MNIIISSSPKKGDSPHKVPCQYSDLTSESIPGPKYICFINDGLLSTCQIISLMDSWYDVFESLEVDGVFFDVIEIGLADIGRRERRCLHVRNLRTFFTIWVGLNWESQMILVRFS